MSGTMSLSEITRVVLSEFVSYPEEFKIEETTGNSSVIIGISSPQKEDISQIIGKNGQTITSLKKILERIAHKRQVRCTVYVVD